MALSPTSQIWFYVELILKDISTGAAPVTYKLSNREVLSDVDTYYPILRDIDNVGSRMGEYLPQAVVGTITIDDRPNSFGFERRFSDLFERYTPVGQTVNIYGALTDIDDNNPTGDFSLLYSAKVGKWSKAPQDFSLILECDNVLFERRAVSKLVDAVSFPSAPTASLGKYLPLVFGTSIDVRPVRIDADADASPQWAYATTLKNTYPVGGITGYYAKDDKGKYQLVQGAATTSTVLYGNALTAGKSHVSHGVGKWARKFTTSSRGYVVTSVKYRLYKNAGSETGIYSIEICKNDGIQNAAPTSSPGTVIGTAKYDLSLFAAGAGEYDVDAAFDKPIVLAPSTDYYITARYESTAGGSSPTYIEIYYDNAVAGTSYYTANPTGASAYWVEITGSTYSKEIFWELYGVALADTTKIASSDADGYGYAFFEATQRSPSGYTLADMTKIDWVLTIDGLKDDTGGTLTGVANTQLTQPNHIARLLLLTYNGSSWVAGEYNTSKYTATHTQLATTTSTYYRAVAGATSGRQTAEQVLREICYNTRCRLALVNHASTRLGLYADGSTITSSYTLTDAEASILSVESKGVDGIVNHIQMFYDQRQRDLQIDNAQVTQEFKNYAKTLDWYYATNTLATSTSTVSNTLYDERLLAQINFNWLNDTTSAERVAWLILGMFCKESWYVRFTVPLFKYASIDIFDVVTLVHPELPAYFGTSPKTDPPSYNGDDVSTWAGDSVIARANQYRVQIEAREINFNVGDYPELILTARILNNALDLT